MKNSLYLIIILLSFSLGCKLNCTVEILPKQPIYLVPMGGGDGPPPMKMPDIKSDLKPLSLDKYASVKYYI